MSIKKLAKAINNVADAIRYHADAQKSGATMAPQDYADMEARVLANINLDVDNCQTPPDTTETLRAEGFDIAAKSPPVSTGNFTLETSLVAVADDVADYVDPYDMPSAEKLDAPGWQTLTVEELDKKGVEVDADGLPWDERIHSGGKTKLVDGTWREKRGVDDDERAEVVAELKALMAIPTPVDNSDPTPVDNLEGLAEYIESQPKVGATPPPPAPAAPTPVDTPAPAPVDNLPAFIKAVTAAKIEAAKVGEAVKVVGLESVTQLGARPDLIPAVAKELGL